MNDAHPVTGDAYHLPVLCSEAVAYLVTRPEGTYVDGTVGGGGHAAHICNRLMQGGRLVAFDCDDDALRAARIRLRDVTREVTLVHANFAQLRDELARRGISGIDGLLLDLGVSSFQIDEAERGFTYRAPAPLDMRMDRQRPLRAADVVNGYDEKSLADLIFRYGEERHARRVARAIVARRPLDSSEALRDAVARAVGAKGLTKSLARVYQALRIEINGELENLERGLRDGTEVLRSGGRLVVISYHSLEDRIVKEFFRRESASSVPSGTPLAPDTPREPVLKVLTLRPITPPVAEIKENPRARSAKMRVAEKR